jgi:hypothetical protein
MSLIVAVIAVADSPRLYSRDRQQLLLLDGAYTDDSALLVHLRKVVDGEVRRAVVHRVDLVNDTTLVDVRWRRTGDGPGEELVAGSSVNADSAVVRA